MPRKRKIQNGDEEGEWIMSYADTVTLLLCFFVIFFSESKYGQDSTQEAIVTVEPEVQAKVSEQAVEIDKQLKSLTTLKYELEARLEKESLKDFEVIQSEKDISIRLNERGFFKLGSFKVLPTGQEKLRKIALSLKNMQEDFMIHVEGHTDSRPVNSSSFYSSNLGLSSLRASSAAEFLISRGLIANKVRAVGFGESQPLSIDRTIASDSGHVTYFEEKARLNRRIEIRLLSQIRAKD